MKLKIENLRGQCYDGAAVMSGKKTGVATVLKARMKKLFLPTAMVML